MKSLFLSCFAALSLSVSAQHYYNDIITTREINERFSRFIANRVATVSASGFDERNMKNPDFNEWQEVKAKGTALQVTTRNKFEKSILYYSFDGQKRVSSITDSTGGTGSKTTYQYDPQNGNLLSVQNSTADAGQGIDQKEIHKWIYAADGKPEKMYRIINDTDSTEYRLGRDEQGNVSDEQVYRSNTKFGDPVYYYYDESNRLTDIVRYDRNVKMLMPETLFEYDAAGNVIQKMVVTSNINRDYIIWRYLYNDKGLKTKEVLFNKNKEQTGKVEYAFTFAP